MPVIEKAVQTRPSGTSATAIYTLPAASRFVGRELLACNTHSGDVVVSVYVDLNGSTFDATNIVLKDYTIPAGETRALGSILGNYIVLDTEGSTIGIKVDTVDVCVFTLTGAVIT